jgi:hypothetical protein
MATKDVRVKHFMCYSPVMPETTAEALARLRMETTLLARKIRAELEASRAHAGELQAQLVDAEHLGRRLALDAAAARRHRHLGPGETTGPQRRLGDGM